MKSVPSRRLEDRIRDLCYLAISAEDDEHIVPLFEQLRDALHSHAQHLRDSARGRLAAGLPIIERRKKVQTVDGSDGLMRKAKK